MLSCKHSYSSSQDSLDIYEKYGVSPPMPIPETVLDSLYTGYEDGVLRCKHELPMFRYVCFEGENTGRRFSACGVKDKEMCDKIFWVDTIWPPTLRNSLTRLWDMHEDETSSRIHGDVEYANKNYALVLEKKELEKKNIELHKQVTNAMQYVEEIKNQELELLVSQREKAEKEVFSLKLENKKLKTQLAKRQKLEVYVGDEVAALKEEKKKKMEVYLGDLLKLTHVQNDKMKKIIAICGE